MDQEGQEQAAGSRKQLVLGPPGFDKIAIVGSAPSSVQLGPWKDPTWAVWGCSPGAYGNIPAGRANVWFEMHRWEPAAIGDPRDPNNKPWFSPEYVRFLEIFEGVVYMSTQVPSVQGCEVYPFDEMLAEFGPFFWTSSIAYMLALAIKMRPRAIGLWGVDMAAVGEYAFQRPACQHFLGIAAGLGIQIVLPPESDLLQPCVPYGFIEQHPRYTKLLRRREELASQAAFLDQRIASDTKQSTIFKGCVDTLDYVLTTWAGDVDAGLSMSKSISHAAVMAGRPVPLIAASHRFPQSAVPPALKLNPPLVPEDDSEWQKPTEEALRAEYLRGVQDTQATFVRVAEQAANPPRMEDGSKIPAAAVATKDRKIKRKRPSKR